MVMTDPHVPKAILRTQIKTVLEIAAQRKLDVKVTLMEPGGGADWEPPRPLSLSDFKPAALTQVFKNSPKNQRTGEVASRLDLAIKDFDRYYADVADPGGSCAKTVRAADRLRSEDFTLAVIMLRRNLCPTPRVTVTLPPSRRLVVVLARAADQDDDCSLVAEEARLKTAFPQSTLLQDITRSGLDVLLTSGYEERPIAHLVVKGCKSAPSAPTTNTAIPAAAPPISDTTMEANESLRILMPHNRARTPRSTAFQGAGAQPGETLWPVVLINGEAWVNAAVRARNDGRFDGTVVIGRPEQDCNEVYQLRVISGVRRPLIAGQVLGGWPEGQMSLPVELIRAGDCGPASR